MPTASDGTEFPYTKEGMAAYKTYQDALDRNNKGMGTSKSDPRHPMNAETTATKYTPRYRAGMRS